MPVVHDTPAAEPEKKPNTVQIAKPQYRGVVVDTRYVPQSALLTNIEGSSWTVNYYSQVLGADNDLSGQQMNRDAIDQQYKLIHKLELKVQTPLTSQQDQESKQMHVTGTAVTYPFLVPQEGDMFLADVGDGREGVFEITNTERRTYFKESCFEIQYVLVSYGNPQRTGDLNRKVVQELYFERDFLIHGQNPLLMPQDYEDVQVLSRKYFDIMNIYFKMFHSNEYMTMLLPGQAQPTYDHFLMKALNAFFNTWDTPLIRENRIFNVDDADAMKCFTLWDALMRNEKDLLPFINKKAALQTTFAFTEQPMFEGIRYSGLQYVVYPGDLEVCVDYEVRKRAPCAMGVKLCNPPSRPGILDELLGQKVMSGLPYTGAPLITPVLQDDYYIFSEAFYHDLPGQSMLELAVRDYLNGRALNRRLLVIFTETYQAWGGLERFYYIPIVLMLIRASIRSL
jgi:hypothetical protein